MLAYMQDLCYALTKYVIDSLCPVLDVVEVCMGKSLHIFDKFT